MNKDDLAKQIADWNKRTANKARNQELDDIASAIIFGGDHGQNLGAGPAYRREQMYQARALFLRLVKTGICRASVLKVITYLTKFSVDHGVDVLLISRTGIAYYTGLSRKSVLDALRFLAKNNVIAFGPVRAVKGRPQELLVLDCKQWFKSQNPQNNNK